MNTDLDKVHKLAKVLRNGYPRMIWRRSDCKVNVRITGLRRMEGGCQ